MSRSKAYDRRWRKIRYSFLARFPFCIGCDALGQVTPATEVDHKIPLVEGGTHDETNLQPFCKSCHSRKTAEDRRDRTGKQVDERNTFSPLGCRTPKDIRDAIRGKGKR